MHHKLIVTNKYITSYLTFLIHKENMNKKYETVIEVCNFKHGLQVRLNEFHVLNIWTQSSKLVTVM